MTMVYRFLCAAALCVTLVSSARIDSISPNAGSVLGQTRLSILGIGFDMRGRSNLVYIGSQMTGAFCDPIPNECTPTRIVCLTAAHDDVGVLPLSVNSFGFSAICNVAGGCVFSYSILRTPQVTSIFPQYVIAPANITVVGTQFTQGDPSVAAFDFTLHIGDEERCQLNTVITNQFVCLVNSMRPGVLPLQLILGASGQAFIPPQFSFLTVVPSISGITPSSGSTAGGQEVTITGAGFSPDLSDNYVTIHGAPCIVNSYLSGTITCITTRNPATSISPAPLAIPGAYLVDQFLNIPGGDVYANMIGLSSYLQPDMTTVINSPQGLAALPYCQNCGFRMTTQFVANETGGHIFSFVGDDGWEVWLGGDANPVVRGQQAPASGGSRVTDADIAVFNTRRIAFYPSYGVRVNSSVIQLVAGSSYWMRMFLKQGAGGMSLSGIVYLPTSKAKVAVESRFRYVPDWTPPVRVTVRDTPAMFSPSCLNQSTCNYDFLIEQTPTVLSVTPASATALTTITISGLMFDYSTAAPLNASCDINQCGGGGCNCLDEPSCDATIPFAHGT